MSKRGRLKGVKKNRGVGKKPKYNKKSKKMKKKFKRLESK